MTENCKHDAVRTNYNNDWICDQCGAKLVPTWTVKPEPIKLEFETAVSWKIESDSFRFSDLKAMQEFSRIADNRKRFKITAEEIL